MQSGDKWIVAGVSGCGKTTVGRELAFRIGGVFLDGDDFHPETNRAKMRSGMPLTDRDRTAWLETLGAELAARPEPVVLACSALKRAYRDRLRKAVEPLYFILLAVDESELRRRLEARADSHFFPPSLLRSQLDTLEIDDDFDLIIDCKGKRPEAIVDRITQSLP